MHTRVQIDAWDPVAAAAVSLYAVSHDEPNACHAGGGTWWPMLTKLPVLRYDLFDGAFGGQITAPSSSLAMRTEAWPNFGRYSLADARLRLWTGSADTNTWTLRFDGLVTAQPHVVDGAAELDFAVDDRWLDSALLLTYAGTTGAEGPAAMKGQAKPWALGAPRYVPGKLIDSVNNVFQVSAYGTIQEFEAALEKLARFGAPIADYANYAALVAATVPAGTWATAKAVGMARFGAPPTGQISFLIKGDNSGSDGWARKPGQLIRQLAKRSGGSGKIHDASLNALDDARPYNLSLYLDNQTTARDLIQAIAASVNAVAGMSWTGQLFVVPVGLSAPTVTLAADGTALPLVVSVEQIDIAAPWKKLAIGAARAWQVHALADIAFTATLVDTGAYDAAVTYREGNIVQDQGSSWLYTNPTPTAGHAPPTLPSGSNSWWKVLAAQGPTGAGTFTLTPISGATISTPNSVQFTAPGWVCKARTVEAYANAAVSGMLTVDTGLGLDDYPTEDGSFGSVRYWFHRSSNGFIYCYRNGVEQGHFLDPDASTPNVATGLFAIVDDGITVRYYHRGPEVAAFRHASDPTDAAMFGVFNGAVAGSRIEGVTFSAVGAAGTNGISTATVEVYQRASSTPPLPSATVTYDFASKSLTGLDNGWSRTWPSSGTDPVYVTAVTFAAAAATDTAAPSEWAAAAVAAANGGPGATGVTVAPVILYQRTATPSAPALPSTTTTYNFGTNVASGMNNGWVQSLPPSGGAYRWQINATAAATGASDTIAPSEWSAQAIMAQDGEAGVSPKTLNVSRSSITFNASSAGVTYAVQYPQTATVTAKEGTTDITGTTTITATPSDTTNMTVSYSAGVVSITKMDVDLGFISVSAAGFATQTIEVKRTWDPLPPASPTSAPLNFPGEAVSSASFAGAPLSGTALMKANASGAIYVNVGASYYADQPISGTRTMIVQIQPLYRPAAGGAWSAFPAPTTGSYTGSPATSPAAFDPTPGGVGAGAVKTGLTPDAYYEVGIDWRRSSGSGFGVISGTGTVHQ